MWYNKPKVGEKMAKLLIVDDEANIRELIKKYALYSNHEPDSAENGLEAIQKVRVKEYDLVIMDIMMPNLDGFSAIKEIRKFSNVPIVILSSRSEEYDKIYGFELGIDDYVTKPFSPKELMMRVNAIVNRATLRISKESSKNIWIYDQLKIDYAAHLLYIADEKVDLTPKEYELFIYLADNIDKVVAREQLLEKVWGYDFDGDDRTLDTHMKSLRKKIGKYADNIVTIRRVGYRFESK